MKRFACALLGLATILAGWANVHSGEDKVTPITVEWLGQSFFIITSSKGTRIAFDPHNMPEYNVPREVKAVDIVFISHNHNDHTQVVVFENAKKENKPKIVAGCKGVGLRSEWENVKGEFKDLKYYNVGSYHDSLQGMKYGKNAIFVVEVDGWRICHLGDLGHELIPEQIKRIGTVDVLMVPCGGIYALNGAEATKVIAQIKPKQYIFPMHYGTKVFDDLLPIDEFVEK